METLLDLVNIDLKQSIITEPYWKLNAQNQSSCNLWL